MIRRVRAVAGALRQQQTSLRVAAARLRPGSGERYQSSWQDEAVAAQMEALVLEQLGTPEAVPPYRAFLELVDHLLADGLPQPARLIDLGCGVGHYAELLERAHPGRFDYLGLDHSEPMIERARALWPGRAFQVADLFDPAGAGRPADVLLAGALVDVAADGPRALAALLGSAADIVVLHRQRITDGPSTSQVAAGYRGQLTYSSLLNRDDIDRIARESGREVAHAVRVEGPVWSFALRRAGA